MEVISSAKMLMGSAEGLGSGVPALKDKVCGATGSIPAFRSKIPDSRLGMETHQPFILRDDKSNDRGVGNKSSRSLTLDIDARFEVNKSGRLVKHNSGLTQRPGMINTEFANSKAGVQDVNGISPESASSPASCNFPEKTQLMKQKSMCRRGDKRNTKPHKNKCDSFSLKNGLVGFNAVSGGNNYLGLYRLKPDVFDITKHIDELSLDELLCGGYKYPNITIEKKRKAASTSDNLMDSVRKACSVLEDKKALKAPDCADADNCSGGNSANDIVTSAEQSHIDDGDTHISDIPSSEKVQDPVDKIRMSNVADLPLYRPKDILRRLSLLSQKDLDSLLLDTSKTTSSKHCTDPHNSTTLSHRTGLPPFPWSHYSSGGNKSGVDTGKLCSNRTICNGKWLKIKDSIALQKGTEDFLVDFESLTFDQSLVPSLTVIPEAMESGIAPMKVVLPASKMLSDSKAPAEEWSPTHVAAQTLVDIANEFHRNPIKTVKLLKRPAQIAPKACKLTDRSVKFFDPPRSTKLIGPLKFGDNEFPSKKLKLSTNRTNGFVNNMESARKGPLRLSEFSSSSAARSTVRSYKDSSSVRDSYGTDVVKKPFLMKPPKSRHSKLGKSTQ